MFAKRHLHHMHPRRAQLGRQVPETLVCKCTRLLPCSLCQLSVSRKDSSFHLELWLRLHALNLCLSHHNGDEDPVLSRYLRILRVPNMAREVSLVCKIYIHGPAFCLSWPISGPSKVRFDHLLNSISSNLGCPCLSAVLQDSSGMVNQPATPSRFLPPRIKPT